MLTQYKGHRDETGIVVAINCQLFKIPLLIIIQEKSKRVTVAHNDSKSKHLWISQQPVFPKTVLSFLPVSDADGGIHGKESQELFVQHLVDAAFPGKQQLGEATETGVCNSGCVGDSHWWQPDYRSSKKEIYDTNSHLCNYTCGENMQQVQEGQRPWTDQAKVDKIAHLRIYKTLGSFIWFTDKVCSH